jgi:hypothetical protein
VKRNLPKENQRSGIRNGKRYPAVIMKPNTSSQLNFLGERVCIGSDFRIPGTNSIAFIFFNSDS